MRSIFLRTTAFASFSLLAACGPSRLSDADLTRLCELTVRCSSGIVSQASCEASLESQRDTANMQGCGGQFGAVGRCVIRADECTSGSLPEACQDEQMRLETCVARRQADAGSGRTDTGFTLPDAASGCTFAGEEFGASLCSDGCDNDENGVYDCNDSACCGSVECGAGTVCGGGSCTPAEELSFTYCSDGCDNDGDAVYDCNDSGCCETLAGSCPSTTLCGETSCTPTSESEYTYCVDGCDNDGDGVYDCNDSGCCAALTGSCGLGTLCGEPVGDVSARNSNGFLEVYYMGEWRSVCDDGFDMSDANVACRMLGYSAAESFTTSVSGTNDNFWLDDLACTGSESSFTECTHSGWGVENCSATESVQVVCVF